MHRSAERSSVERSTSVTAENASIIPGETIAAISTPPGEGAIALVRVSGVDAIAVADKIFRGRNKPSEFSPQLQQFGEIVDETGEVIHAMPYHAGSYQDRTSLMREIRREGVDL